MLYDNNYPRFHKLNLIDEMGKVISGVKSFDDETKVAEIYLRSQSGYVVDGGEVVIVKVHLPNARLIDRE